MKVCVWQKSSKKQILETIDHINEPCHSPACKLIDINGSIIAIIIFVSIEHTYHSLDKSNWTRIHSQVSLVLVVFLILSYFFLILSCSSSATRLLLSFLIFNIIYCNYWPKKRWLHLNLFFFLAEFYIKGLILCVSHLIFLFSFAFIQFIDLIFFWFFIFVFVFWWGEIRLFVSPKSLVSKIRDLKHKLNWCKYFQYIGLFCLLLQSNTSWNICSLSIIFC